MTAPLRADQRAAAAELVGVVFGRASNPPLWPAAWLPHTRGIELRGERHGELQGLVLARPCRVSDGGVWHASAWISHVAVRAEFRGRGLGSALVREACRAACERGARFAALCAARTDLYARAGFEHRGDLWRCDVSLTELRGSRSRGRDRHGARYEVRHESEDDARAVEEHGLRLAAHADDLVWPRESAGHEPPRPPRRNVVVTAENAVRARAVVSFVRGPRGPLVLLESFSCEDDAACASLLEWIASRVGGRGELRLRAAPNSPFARTLPPGAARFTRGEAWMRARLDTDGSEGGQPLATHGAPNARPSHPTRFGS